METNAGKKEINSQGDVPGYGTVYHNSKAMTNLFSLSDMVKKRHRVYLDTNKENRFVTKGPDGRISRFPCDA